MLKEDALALLAVVIGLGLLLLFGYLVWSRWRDSAPQRRISADARRAGLDDFAWRTRLSDLNNLLSRVQASDSDRQSLDSELAGHISAYLGDGIGGRTIPASTNQVLADIVYADRLLVEVRTACRDRAALPAVMAQQVEQYLDEQPSLGR